jgi:hypothetical protein
MKVQEVFLKTEEPASVKTNGKLLKTKSELNGVSQ